MGLTSAEVDTGLQRLEDLREQIEIVEEQRRDLYARRLALWHDLNGELTHAALAEVSGVTRPYVTKRLGAV